MEADIRGELAMRVHQKRGNDFLSQKKPGAGENSHTAALVKPTFFQWEANSIKVFFPVGGKQGEKKGCTEIKIFGVRKTRGGFEGRLSETLH